MPATRTFIHALVLAACLPAAAALAPRATAAGTTTSTFTLTLTVEDACTVASTRFLPERSGRITLSCNAGVRLRGLAVDGSLLPSRYPIDMDAVTLARDCPEEFATSRPTLALGLHRVSFCTSVLSQPRAGDRSRGRALAVTAVYD